MVNIISSSENEETHPSELKALQDQMWAKEFVHIPKIICLEDYQKVLLETNKKSENILILEYILQKNKLTELLDNNISIYNNKEIKEDCSGDLFLMSCIYGFTPFWCGMVYAFLKKKDNPYKKNYSQAISAFEAEKIQYEEYLKIREAIIDLKNGKALNFGNSNPKKLTHIVVGLFCRLVDNSQLIPRGQEENVEDYCKKICNVYQLLYKDNVRQNYSERRQQKYYEKLINNLLPKLDQISREKLITYLKSQKKIK